MFYFPSLSMIADWDRMESVHIIPECSPPNPRIPVTALKNHLIVLDGEHLLWLWMSHRATRFRRHRDNFYSSHYELGNPMDLLKTNPLRAGIFMDTYKMHWKIGLSLRIPGFFGEEGKLSLRANPESKSWLHQEEKWGYLKAGCRNSEAGASKVQIHTRGSVNLISVFIGTIFFGFLGWL